MHFIIIILALMGASVSAFPTLLSSPVSVSFFNKASCYDDTPPVVVPLEANKCFAFNGAQGLKVNRHDEDLKYNAREYSYEQVLSGDIGANCDSTCVQGRRVRWRMDAAAASRGVFGCQCVRICQGCYWGVEWDQ
jgi:hypothetical protein